MTKIKTMLKTSAVLGSLAVLAACQQTEAQIESNKANYARQGAAANEVLSDPTLACSQYLTSGSLPQQALTNAGFSPTRNGYTRQITAPTFSMPNGHNVGVATTKRGGCNISVVNAPFSLPFTQSAVHNKMISNGWENEGKLVYSKGASRVKLNGGSSYGVVYLGFTPV